MNHAWSVKQHFLTLYRFRTVSMTNSSQYCDSVEGPRTTPLCLSIPAISRQAWGWCLQHRLPPSCNRTATPLVTVSVKGRHQSSCHRFWEGGQSWRWSLTVWWWV